MSETNTTATDGEQPDTTLDTGQSDSGSANSTQDEFVEDSDPNAIPYDSPESLAGADDAGADKKAKATDAGDDKKTEAEDTDESDTEESGSEERFLDWESKEEAEKGVAHLRKDHTQTKQELSELRRIVETLTTKAADAPMSKEDADKLLDEMMKNPVAFIRKHGGAKEELAARDAAEEEFETLSDVAENEAQQRVDKEWKDALTPEVLKLRAKLLTPGFDKKMTMLLKQIHVGNYRGENGKPKDLVGFNEHLFTIATEKAIARLAGKTVQDAKVKTKRDTKRNERKKSRLGVHQSGGRVRDTRSDSTRASQKQLIDDLIKVGPVSSV